jgi:hypothetical protein
MTGLMRGDKVEWNTSQGPTTGTVVRRVTATAHVKGHVAKASPAHPELEVRSEKSGARTVHRAGALRKAG